MTILLAVIGGVLLGWGLLFAGAMFAMKWMWKDLQEPLSKPHDNIQIYKKFRECSASRLDNKKLKERIKNN